MAPSREQSAQKMTAAATFGGAVGLAYVQGAKAEHDAKIAQIQLIADTGGSEWEEKKPLTVARAAYPFFLLASAAAGAPIIAAASFIQPNFEANPLAGILIYIGYVLLAAHGFTYLVFGKDRPGWTRAKKITLALGAFAALAPIIFAPAAEMAVAIIITVWGFLAAIYGAFALRYGADRKVYAPRIVRQSIPPSTAYLAAQAAANAGRPVISPNTDRDTNTRYSVPAFGE